MKLRYASLLILLAGVAWGDVTSLNTLPGGSNGSVQTNKSGRFNGDTYLTYSTSTHVLSAPTVGLTYLKANGQTYTFPASTCAGGTVFTLDGANGISCAAPTATFTSTGTALAVFDGGVSVSSPTSALNFNGSQFIVSLQGSTTSSIAVDPSSVTLAGQIVDIAAHTNLAVTSPLTLSGHTLDIDRSSFTLLGPNVDLTSEVTGVLPAANLPTTTVYSNTTQTIDGFKTFTAPITVTHSGGITSTYGIVGGSLTANDLTASSAVRTDANKKLVSGGPLYTEIPGGATSYIQLGSTLQTGATFYVSSGTVNTLNAGSLAVTGVAGETVTYGLTAATGTFSSATVPQLSVMNPNFAGLYAAGIGFGFNGTPYGYLNQNSASVACSDLSGNCMTTPLSYGTSTSASVGKWAVDVNGKMSVGQYTGSKSTATIWGNMLIGSGYTTATNAPTNGLRVQGNVVIDSSASVNGSSGVYVAYGLTAATVTVNDDAYAAGWDGSTLVPTKNAVYDKIQTLSAGSGSSIYPATSTASFPFGYTASSTTVSTTTITSSMTVSGNALFVGTATFTGRITTSTVAGFGVSGMSLQSQGATSAPTWSFANSIPQLSTAIITTSSSTVVAGFVSTGLTKSITPKSTSSAIWVGFSGNIRTSNCSNLQAELSIFNGTTDLCAGGSSARGCAYIGCAAGTDAFDVPGSFFLINCPNTTSAVTYTLRIKADGSGTATVDNQGTQAALTVFEIGPNGMCP